MPKVANLTGWVWVGVFVLLLFSGCTENKVTSPSFTGPFLMTNYFPLSQGNEWTWKIQNDTLHEPYEDGDVNLGEPYIDLNNTGHYDVGEEYDDLNSNGKYDGPNDPWSEGVPFVDRNDNGEFDLPNGEYDEGEFFLDLDSNGEYSPLLISLLKGETFIANSESPDGSILFKQHWVYKDKLVGWGYVATHYDDYYSNDSLGLRWHSHVTGSEFSPQDDLKDYGPITLATAQMAIGDSVINVDSSGIHIWISVLEAMELVKVPGELILSCLKFRSVASGWTGNMQEYNGTIFAWYAKYVGLVKLETAAGIVHWQLESATVSNRTYP